MAIKKLDDLDKALHAEGVEERALLLEGLQQEAMLLASLRHPNIVAFMGICMDPPCIVTEICQKGSLTDVIRAARRDPRCAAELTWRVRLTIAAGAAKGMLCLHRQNPPIIHRDLKSPNLLVDDGWRTKVADFNLSRMMNETGSMNTMGTMANVNPRWLAPEVLRGGKASVASDLFSMGVVLWELLAWDVPWAREDTFRIMCLVGTEGARPPVPPAERVPGGSFSGLPGYVALMQRCWAQQPEDRPPSFKEVVKSLE